MNVVKITFVSNSRSHHSSMLDEESKNSAYQPQFANFVTGSIRNRKLIVTRVVIVGSLQKIGISIPWVSLSRISFNPVSYE
jgi:hypothetical protein